MRILFAAGGTGGHINPALAIAKEFRTYHPDCEILFVGTEFGLETELVPREGFPIEYIEAIGFRRRFTWENIRVAYRAARSMVHTSKILKKFRPDLVIGCGGYTSGPVVMRAAMKKIPTLIHEQNAFPGMSNKMLAPKVDRICISFEDSKKYFKQQEKVVYTGNPVRPGLTTLSKEKARLQNKIDDRPFLLAVGGSLGAKRINEEMLKLIPRLNNQVQVLWAAGKTDYETVKKAAGTLPSNITLCPYIFNMEEMMIAADLVISRSGAITLSELCATGTPSILIPSPNVTENHQEINARALEKRNAAVVLCENELSDNRLESLINQLAFDKVRLTEMGSHAREMANVNASFQIYQEGMKLIQTS